MDLWYKIASRIVAVIYRCCFKIRRIGLENLPESGGFLMCCNHLSNNDPVLIGCFLPVQVHFLAKKELFQNPLFGALLKSLGAIPLERGAADMAAIKESMRIMKSGKGLLVFPQGTRRRELRQRDFKPGSLTMAYRAKVPVVPVAITGAYRFRSEMKITVGKQISVEELAEKIEQTPEQERNGMLSNLIYDKIQELAAQA